MSPKEYAQQSLRDGASLSKTDIAILYGISSKTLRRRLNAVPGFKGDRRRVYMPAEYRIIFTFLGTPTP